MKIEIDKNAKTAPTDTSWQFGIGNDHAFQMHRTDVCEHVKLVREELGIRYIRFHGIFDDDMLCCQRLSDYKPFRTVPYSKRVEEINFKQAALVYDNVLACGMKPFVELSFMPSALASGKKTGIRYLNNITKPKSLERWSRFIKSFIRFLLVRYGKEEVESWYFEVWNEPDLAIFFKGKQKDYFRLYEVTARAVKSVDKKLRVGGPSSSACLWVREFTKYCEQNQVPCDFVSTHHYPGDAFGNSFSMKDAFHMMSIAKNSAKGGADLTETITKMFFHPERYKTWRKGVLAELDAKARNEAGEKPLFITEWNSMAVFASPVHDEKYSAAFVIKSCMDLRNQIQGYMFWCCSDVYEEQFMLGKPFHGGFGLVSNDGIPKPNFWAFKILSQLYKRRLILSGCLPGQKEQNIEYAAFTDGDGLQVLLWVQDSDYNKHEEWEAEVTVNLMAKTVTARRIDDTHCNPKAEWEALGKPDLLTPKQAELIKEKTRLCEEELPFEAAGGNTRIVLPIGTNDVVLVTIQE